MDVTGEKEEEKLMWTGSAGSRFLKLYIYTVIYTHAMYIFIIIGNVCIESLYSDVRKWKYVYYAEMVCPPHLEVPLGDADCR